MSHIYSDRFFDYIDESARTSARRLIGVLQPWVQAQSVLDLGSGRGLWLAEWRAQGAQTVLGIDGDYVERDRLAVASEEFQSADLTQPLSLERHFDLAQSLEVGEHLPPDAAETLVDSLTRHSDRVLFSAAVPGQGGEFHINERPLCYWQGLFFARGYSAYDCLRPRLRQDDEVAPWYRYNSVLYVNEAGRDGLPEIVLKSRLPAGAQLQSGGSLAWRLRRGVVRLLPRAAVTRIAQIRAAILARRAGRSVT